MAKQTIPSMELERSMNLQARVMTIEEVLRHSEVIDDLDDSRRSHLHEVINWAKEQHSYFLKNIKDNELKQQFEDFISRFNNIITNVLEKEIELENIDDQNREFLIDYVSITREKLRNENSNFEKEIISRRIARWLNAHAVLISLEVIVLRKNKAKYSDITSVKSAVKLLKLNYIKWKLRK